LLHEIANMLKDDGYWAYIGSLSFFIFVLFLPAPESTVLFLTLCNCY
jgi:hypothetical protein